MLLIIAMMHSILKRKIEDYKMEFNDWQEIHDYCMAKPCAYETRPFGEFPICYRIAGKIFAQLSPEENWFKITLKTNPDAADFYRRAYPGVVVRGYHCPPVQQPYWNTIDLDKFDKDTLFQMIDEAYDEVLKHLPKKEQRRIPVNSSYKFVKTDGENPAFVELCGKLDAALGNVIGVEKQKSLFDKYNQRDDIHDTIVIFHDNKPVGCGAYKLYDDETVELKRIYIDESVRGLGLSKELVRRLEADARIKGFRYAVLETGHKLVRAVELYKRMGYKIIPNYGPYANMPESVCMSKKL